MSYYGKNKARQMTKSILPCIAGSRKSVKNNLNARRRQNRRIVNDMTENYKGLTASKAEEFFDDAGQNLDYYIEMHHWSKGFDDLVQERRDRDHLNHFLRWARETTKDMNPEERYPYVENLLGSGFLSDHALGHVKFELDPTRPAHYYRQRRLESQREMARVRNIFMKMMKDAIRNVSRDDRRRNALNEYLKKRTSPCVFNVLVPGCKYVWCGCNASTIRNREHRKYEEHKCNVVRTMHGYHDAARFLEDVYRRRCDGCDERSHSHTDWLKLTIEFLGIEVPEGISIDHFR